MRVWFSTDHAEFYPVGSASVVVANSAEEAIEVLRAALIKHGLPDAPFTVQELDTTHPNAVILCDGNY